MMMMNEMRTGEIVMSGDGNYAASSNGQCLLHLRSRMQQHQTTSAAASNGSGSSIKKSLPGRTGEDVVKRTRSMNVYELSQDLLDKQIELLERKYGGHARSNHAARVIQRAFRHYSMRRKFATITAMAKADQRRLSRRIHTELVDSAWNVTAEEESCLMADGQHFVPSSSMSADDSGSRAEYVIRTNFAALYRELAETVEGARSAAAASPSSSASTRSPARQQTRLSPQRHQHQHHVHHLSHHSHHHPHYVLQRQQQVPALAPAVAGHYQYHVQQQYHHAHCHATPGVCVSIAPTPPPASHTPYGNHNHLVTGAHGELRRSDSKSSSSSSSTSSKRVPPEVPRRVSSTLTAGGKSPLPYDYHHTQQPRCQTPVSHQPMSADDPQQQQRRTSNLSTEHSTSEDSLEGAGYSTTFWSESNGGTASGSGNGLNGNGTGHHTNSVGNHHHPSHVHSSPVPFPPAHYVMNGSALVASGTPTANGTAAGAAVYGGSNGSQQPTPAQAKVLESIRKRQYRVGLNLFNKKPERGIAYLTQKGFLEASPRAVAKFFISRKGVSKQMIGEYLGNLQNSFNMATLDFFIEELDFAGLEIDVALRRFQTYFRMPGEAQKIERLMEVFGQRYCQCNPQLAARLCNPDTVFILAFAIIMLNTDLHTPSIKADKRMKLEDFIKNLRGIDDGANIDHDLLVGIYERVRDNEFKPGADHVTQVLKVQQSIVGKKPNLVLPHRRLVCYCRLYEVADAARRERPGLHQREVFLFNDILVVTKIFSKKKNGVTYSFRQSFQLAGLNVSYFESHHYPFGIRLSQRVDGRTLIMFNARNDHDRAKFCEDLREAILEMDEMETLRIEGELDKQRSAPRINRSANSTALSASHGAAVGTGNTTATSQVAIRDKADNRDSGVADMDHSGSVSTLDETGTPLIRRASGGIGQSRSLLTRDSVATRSDVQLKRTTLSNSLLDIHGGLDPVERYQRRGSVGSLDSGMSISFQSSTTASTISRDSSPKNLLHQQQVQQQQASAASATVAAAAVSVASTPTNSNVGKARGLQHQSSFLGNIFHKARERKNSFGSSSSSSATKQQHVTSYPTPQCTDV